ncbi:MAG: DMT family transporter, partial [Sciscionella sp.]
ALMIRSEVRPGAMRLTGLLLGFAGTVVIFSPWQSGGVANWGALACLIAAISYAVSYTYIAKQLSAQLPPLALSVGQLTTGAAFTAIALPIGGRAAMHLPMDVVIPVAVLGIFGTAIAFVLNNRLIADEGATTAASVGYLIPVVSVLLGALALHEPLTPQVVIGMLVVVAGVALSRQHRPIGPRFGCLQDHQTSDTLRGLEDTQTYTRRRSEAQRESS